MADITELAQRITERKFHDWSQSVMHDCDFCNQWSLTVKHENGERICASCCDDEYTSKLEVANAALVEALEKAQQRIAELEDAEQKLCAANVTLDARAELQARIAELESRTVKLPKAMSIEGGAYCSAHAHYDADGDYYDRADVEKMLADAGIKVEAE